MRRAVILAAALWVASGAARAQSLEVSPDTTAVLAGTVVGRGQVAQDDRAGHVVPTVLDPLSPTFVLPKGANLAAFERLANGDVLFSTDVPVTLPGLPSSGARPGDVVRVSGTLTTIAFSATAAGLPAGVNVDAVGVESDGDLLLSFDTAVTLGGLRVDDEDVVRIDAATGATSLAFDGSAQGIAEGLDLDAVSRPLASNHLLLSFDGPGVAKGVRFDAEDVLDWNRATGALHALLRRQRDSRGVGAGYQPRRGVGLLARRRRGRRDRHRGQLPLREQPESIWTRPGSARAPVPMASATTASAATSPATGACQTRT